MANVRRRRSAQGRYVPAPRGLSSFSVLGCSFLAPLGTAGLGAIRGRQGLAGARTPAYFTVWKRGGGTLAASLVRSESGSMSTAVVPSR